MNVIYIQIWISKKKRFSKPKEETYSVYLNSDELKKIYKCDLSDEPRLDRVRDLFLIGCCTGLRFSDLSLLSSDNIDNVESVITIKTVKTGRTVVIPFACDSSADIAEI